MSPRAEAIFRFFPSIQIWSTFPITILLSSSRHRGLVSRLGEQSTSVRELASVRHSVDGDGGLAQDLPGLLTPSLSIAVHGTACGSIDPHTFTPTCILGCDRLGRAWRYIGLK